MSLKLLTIVGARPQIIKAAAISRTIKSNFSNEIQEDILHTGQHYDQNMSAVFFDELQIPQPQYQLQCGSTNNSNQTAQMLTGISNILEKNKYDLLLVYGDTNSTLAGAMAGAQHQIPVAHIEAGLRSFNKTMPEELNRITTDHYSTFLFAPTKEALKNLHAENLHFDASKKPHLNNPFIALTGDIMFDNAMHYSQNLDTHLLRNKYPKPFILATVHRNFNTDNESRFLEILKGLHTIAELSNFKIILPIHPRTVKVLQKLNINLHANIQIIEPLSYTEMLYLEKEAELIITDSGGVQKEAYFFNKKSIILRPETEWVEIIEHGSALLTDASAEKMLDAYTKLMEKSISSYPPIYGDAQASHFILKSILKHI